MVRLKAFNTCKPLTMSFLFQFLMVRLKASSSDKFAKLSKKFQFLMVRLKVGITNYYKSAKQVSIPYGAIKR